MNLKRVFAGVVAASVAVSALAVGAFAATEINIKPNDPGELVEYYDGNYFLDVWGDAFIIDSADKLNGAVAIGITFEVSEFDNYGDYINVEVNVWGETDGDYFDEVGEPVAVEADGEYTAWIELDSPVEINDEFGFALHVFLDEEYGNGGVPVFAVTNVLAQVEGGAAETEAPETEAPETEVPETEAPETDAPATDAPETEAPTTGDSSKPSAGTGVEGIAVAAGVAVIAAGAAVVAKKRK
ncbi:MAG: hypothetical protein J1E39_06635 [Eubacterium sp.]|nr:hypothetical protein [Eubacterium sp.]